MYVREYSYIYIYIYHYCFLLSNYLILLVALCVYYQFLHCVWNESVMMKQSICRNIYALFCSITNKVFSGMS